MRNKTHRSKCIWKYICIIFQNTSSAKREKLSLVKFRAPSQLYLLPACIELGSHICLTECFSTEVMASVLDLLWTHAPKVFGVGEKLYPVKLQMDNQSMSLSLTHKELELLMKTKLMTLESLLLPYYQLALSFTIPRDLLMKMLCRIWA